MDKNVRLFVLLGLGGVGVYLIWKGGYFQQWLPSLFPAGGDAATVAAAAKAKADAAIRAAAADPTNAAAQAAAAKAKADADAAMAEAARVSAAAAKAAADKLAAEQQLCWDGTYISKAATCPVRPAPATGLTPEQIAAQTAQAAKSQLYSQLVVAGVDPVTAQTYIDHCGANGQCDQTYLVQMYQQAALGVPNMMKLTDVGGILFNADQWQYYRKSAGGSELDPGEIFLDRVKPIHASEFNAALNLYAAGGGMSGGRMMRPGLGWVV